ncbi:monocarboxylate transporter 13-like isoform X2 [Anneissia japonica]|uniref:monocarboxylate transporter 13-like isoform X2 n=1 Tax=Anneissia japonica TaxID=1529436 RepID=UPI0014259BDC|nr:monocarboxylate transporter 13-like isoform X2 [Anneissia japonica]
MGKNIDSKVFPENLETNCVAQCSKRTQKLLQEYQGWAIVFVSAIMYIPVLGVLYNYNLLFVRLQEEFDSGAGETGWIGCLAIALLTLPSPLSTFLAEKITYRGIVALGLVMCSIGLLVTSFMPSIKYIFFSYSIVFGLGTNFIQHPSLSLIVLYFDERKCAKATGLAITGTGAGIMATSQILEFLFNILGWRGALRVMAAIILPVGLVCCAFLKSPPRNSTADYKTVQNIEEAYPSKKLEAEVYTDTKKVYLEVVFEEHESKSFSRKFIKFLTTIECWLVIFSYTGMGIAVVFSYVNLASYMKTVGFSDDQGSAAIGIMGGADLLGRLVITLIGGKLPISVAGMYILACLIGAIPIASLPFATTFTSVAICYSVITGYNSWGPWGKAPILNPVYELTTTLACRTHP